MSWDNWKNEEVLQIDANSPFYSILDESAIQINKNKLSEKNNIFSKFLELKIKEFKTNNDFETSPKTTFEELSKTINNVYKKLIGPINKKERQNFAVIGNVQSGKTNFMMGLVAKLFSQNGDNEFKMVIILSSNNSTLNNQTFQRFKETFDETLGMTEWNFYGYEDLKNVSSLEKEIHLKSFSKRKTIFFLQKQKNHLEKMNIFIEKIKSLGLLGETTILDDEGDQASFDNVKKTDQTTINKNIRSIIDYGINFISVTATPFAHLLADKNSNMKPDYYFYLKPGDGYEGVCNYFGKQLQEKKSKMIKIIKDNDNSLECYLEEEAIAHFLVQCLLFPKITKSSHKPRMMVNIIREKENHYLQREYIWSRINLWKENPHLWHDYLKNIIDDYLDFFPKQKNVDDDFIKEIQIQIQEDVLPRVSVEILNSDNKYNLKLDNHNTSRNQIIVGSDKLSRGLTFKDLTCSYVVRRSKSQSNADMVLQMARWFGYTKQYIKLSKVFLTPDLIDDYIWIQSSLTEIIKSIQDHELQNETQDVSAKESKRLSHVPTPNSIRQDQGPVRRTIGDYYWVPGLKKSYMNNKNEATQNEANEKFKSNFEKRYEKEPKQFGSYPAISFDSFADFNKDFFSSNPDYSVLKQEYYKLFKTPSGVEQNIDLVKEISDSFGDKKVWIRFINEKGIKLEDIEYKSRKVNETNSFGQGNYKEEFDFSDDVIMIDIIPILLWGINEEDKKITRAKLFIPNKILEKIDCAGFSSKNK